MESAVRTFGLRGCMCVVTQDSVAATEDYLDNYFEKNLAADRSFILRCRKAQ